MSGIDAIFGPNAVGYGGEGLGIGETYPVPVFGIPAEVVAAIQAGATRVPPSLVGLPLDSEVMVIEHEGATSEELAEAGFKAHRDAQNADSPKLVAQNGEEIDPRNLRYYVMRGEDGNILATWDEGRWWTPEESNAFVATMHSPAVRMLAEATHELTRLPNRAERRRRGIR